MSDSETINSREYWSHRFGGDWEAQGGREQSRFFAQLAIDAMPSWLLAAIRSRRVSLCDWGCALGDGTDLLAQVLDVPVTGVDFAAEAVEAARTRYARPSFLQADFLSGEGEETYDILFSSNTLEHFSHPWKILDALAPKARSALILLLPYREYARIDEHEASFESRNIPAVVAGRFHLAHSRVVDARNYTPTLWGSEQILLVYATGEFLESLALRLADLEVGHEATEQLRSRLERADIALNTLVAEKENLRMEREGLRAERDTLQGELDVLRAEKETAGRRAEEEKAVLKQTLSGEILGLRAEIEALHREAESRPRFDYTYTPKIRPLEHLLCGRRIRRLIEQDRRNIHWLTDRCGEFAEEFAKIEETAADPRQPSFNNIWLHALDGLTLYALIRSSKPRIYLEVGSGNSTKFVRRAIADGGLPTRIVSIDPHPREEVAEICDENIRLPLEEVELPPILERLGKNDIVFIGNSHRSFQNSDVTVAFLELLPRLPKGAYLGIHDIFLPFDYHEAFVPCFYNEQYLLAMYLLGGNKDFEIVFPTHYVLNSGYRDAVMPLIERPNIPQGVRGGCAFWMHKTRMFWPDSRRARLMPWL